MGERVFQHSAIQRIVKDIPVTYKPALRTLVRAPAMLLGLSAGAIGGYAALEFTGNGIASEVTISLVTVAAVALAAAVLLMAVSLAYQRKGIARLRGSTLELEELVPRWFRLLPRGALNVALSRVDLPEGRQIDALGLAGTSIRLRLRFHPQNDKEAKALYQLLTTATQPHSPENPAS